MESNDKKNKNMVRLFDEEKARLAQEMLKEQIRLKYPKKEDGGAEDGQE